MILLDTNLLVYARNSDVPFHGKAVEIRNNAVNGILEAAIALQSLSEFIAIVTSSRRVENPLTSENASLEVQNYLNCHQLVKLGITEQTMKVLVDLVKKYKVQSQSIFDAQIVAIMIENGIKEIWTANDKDFLKFREVSVNNPFEK